MDRRLARGYVRREKERRQRHWRSFLRWYGDTRVYYPNGLSRKPEIAPGNDRRAVAYCEWLARRNGQEIPSGWKIFATVEWSGVYVGARWQKRPCAVVWQEERQEYFDDRGKGLPRRYGAAMHGYRKVRETLLRIEIPNWDHVPQVTEEIL